jgi:hypothetical protein
MKSEIDIINQIDAYLRGKLSDSELADFEQKRLNDAAFDLKVVEHSNLVSQLSEYSEIIKLKSDMNIIHES